jgi:hypothetical protein
LPALDAPTYADLGALRLHGREGCVKPRRIDELALGRWRLCPLALALCASTISVASLAPAANAPGYTVTAPSVAHVQRGPHGSYKIQAQESRFWLTHDYRRRARFIPRLVTTTTNWSWDGDEKYSVVVTIAELRGHTPRQVAKFSDPGTTGQVLAGDVYYLTMKPPCCGDTGDYYFRSLDTGEFLFRATGNGDVGTTAFLYVHPPGTHAEADRWIAFEGDTAPNPDPGLLGYIRYGDLRGVLSEVQVRVKPDAIPWPRAVGDWDEVEAAKECSFLQWLEDGRVHSSLGRKRPDPGACDLKGEFEPEPIDAHAGKLLPNGITGIEVEYSIAGDVYATIPIVNDHLDVEHAQSADRVMLMDVPPEPDLPTP